jgi:hypothetical protein
MIKIWNFTLFFLFCLVVALGFNIPLTHLLPWVKLPDTIQLSGVDGTIIEGRAQQVMLNRFPLNGVRYRYMPSCIARLKLCYRIDYDQGHLRVAYDLLNGDTEVTNTEIDYPVSTLLVHLSNPLVKPVGSLQLVVRELSFEQGKPVSFEGLLIWRNLGIDDSGIKLDIGDYQLEVSGKSPEYELRLSDLDASLDVKGDGELGAGGVYKVDIAISSDQGINPQVKTVLELVAKKTGHDKYRIQQSGRLPPHIASLLF